MEDLWNVVIDNRHTTNKGLDDEAYISKFFHGVHILS